MIAAVFLPLAMGESNQRKEIFNVKDPTTPLRDGGACLRIKLTRILM
jgi:hypothetical protein